MATVLDDILTEEHRRHGLCLAEDDHIIYLIRNGHNVALWSAQGATLEEIHRIADKEANGDVVADLVGRGAITFEASRHPLGTMT